MNRKFYKVPYCVPHWTLREHLAIFRCLLTGKLIRGTDVDRFINLFRQKTGKRYVFAFGSGAEAIEAALKAWGLGKADQVILPSYLCESVIEAVLHCDAQPLFCDIGSDYNPDIDHILDVLNPKVKAIIFPHLFGNPGSIDRMEAELKRRDPQSRILLIDDAAQSFGAILDGKPVGTFGDAGVISLGPGKTMTASGGGILITDSDVIAERVQRLTSGEEIFLNKFKKIIYWLLFRRWRRYSGAFFPVFKRLLRITKGMPMISKMSNIDAALGCIQLARLEAMLQTRIKRKAVLDNIFQKYTYNRIDKLPRNDRKNDRVNVATKYLFREHGDQDLSEHLQNFYVKERIEIRELYSPLHLNETYRHFSGKLKTTERLWNRVRQIPLEPSMSDRVFQRICDELETALGVISSGQQQYNQQDHLSKERYHATS